MCCQGEDARVFSGLLTASKVRSERLGQRGCVCGVRLAGVMMGAGFRSTDLWGRLEVMLG